MPPEPPPPRIDLPAPPSLNLVGLVSITGAVATLVTYPFISPEQVGIEARVIALVAVVAGILGLPYAGRLAVALARRVWWYPALYDHYERSSEQTDILARMLTRRGATLVQLEVVAFRRDRPGGVLRLRLKKPRSPRLQDGATVLILDVSSGDWLGRFAVVEQTRSDYLIEERRIWDALWWGYMHQLADRHELPPEHIVAVPE
jgi:hypothetical protein